MMDINQINELDDAIEDLESICYQFYVDHEDFDEERAKTLALQICELTGGHNQIINLAETRRINLEHELEMREIIECQRDDLLAACEAFVEAWDKSLQLVKTDIALSMAHAAIARAKGETTP